MKKAILLTIFFLGLLFVQTPKVTAQKQIEAADCPLKVDEATTNYSATCNCYIWVQKCTCGPGYC